MEEYPNSHTTSAWNSSTASSLQSTVLSNASHGCIVLFLSKLKHFPADNPDNIVSKEVEDVSRKTKNILLVFFLLIGGPGNIINMAVFYKQGLKDRVNLCLFALAVTDELYLIMSMLHHAEQVHTQFTTKTFFGPMLKFFINNRLSFLTGTSYVSLILSSIIASERCLCVLYPLKFQALMHTKLMGVIIVVTYIVTLALYFVVSYRFEIGCIYDPISGKVIDAAISGEFYQQHRQFIEHLDGFLFGVGLPTAAVVVVMTATVITVVKLRQIVTWRAGSTSSLSLREVALTKMLVGNSILFLVSTFPRAVFRFSWVFLPDSGDFRHYNFCLATMWYIGIFSYGNSSFNIFMYYAMGSRFRETCKALFKANKPLVKQ